LTGPAPGLIIAAPASGSGKTVLTLGLLRALVRGGCNVASAKVGPDYIDPAYHAAAVGRPCLNLDGWAMRRQTLDALVQKLSASADLVIAEGVMGLFDGAVDGTGSTADLSARTGWPVLLVVDVRGQAASAAAVVLGMTRFRSDVRIAGVVFNRIGGAGHRRAIEKAMRDVCPGIPVVGFVPRTDALHLPSRHLGLVQAGEHLDQEIFLDGAADLIAKSIDLHSLSSLARGHVTGSAGTAPPLPAPGGRVAVARDDAFGFVYPNVLEGWRAEGAAIEFFSPLAGQPPSPSADAIYLPGGYPQLHTGPLAAGRSFLDGLRRASDRGISIYGECGGYMVLGESLVDSDGRAHRMAGLLPLTTSFAEPRLHLGYRRASALDAFAFGGRGAGFRGHEFHYATILEEGSGAPLFDLSDAAGEKRGTGGRINGSVAGSFVHLIDRSDP